MLDHKEFDLWADNYDQSVGISYSDDTYPFAGYKEVLDCIYREVMTSKKSDILDIGFGNAILTSKLYEAGHNIYGQDFSKKMIDIAQEKMPEAKLYQKDFTQGLAQELYN